MNTFGTVINCIDGRVQLPVIQYLQTRWAVDHVDVITEPAPELLVSPGKNGETLKRVLGHVAASLKGQALGRVAVAAHHDCESNPVSETQQQRQLSDMVSCLQEKFVKADIIGLWIDKQGVVHEMNASKLKV